MGIALSNLFYYEEKAKIHDGAVTAVDSRDSRLFSPEVGSGTRRQRDVTTLEACRSHCEHGIPITLIQYSFYHIEFSKRAQPFCYQGKSR